MRASQNADADWPEKAWTASRSLAHEADASMRFLPGAAHVRGRAPLELSAPVLQDGPGMALQPVLKCQPHLTRLVIGAQANNGTADSFLSVAAVGCLHLAANLRSLDICIAYVSAHRPGALRAALAAALRNLRLEALMLRHNVMLPRRTQVAKPPDPADTQACVALQRALQPHSSLRHMAFVDACNEIVAIAGKQLPLLSLRARASNGSGLMCTAAMCRGCLQRLRHCV